MPESIEMLHRILPAVKEYDCECGPRGCSRGCQSEIERAICESKQEIRDNRERFLNERAIHVVHEAASETSCLGLDNGIWHAIKCKLLRGAAYQDESTKQQVRAAALEFRKSR